MLRAAHRNNTCDIVVSVLFYLPVVFPDY